MVSSNEPSEIVRSRERFEGNGGENVSGSTGLCAQFKEAGVWVGASRREVPLRTSLASVRILWRRCSCEDMKRAEWRSPVQRVISTQSRLWFRRLRSWVRGWRRRGRVGERE